MSRSTDVLSALYEFMDDRAFSTRYRNPYGDPEPRDVKYYNDAASKIEDLLDKLQSSISKIHRFDISDVGSLSQSPSGIMTLVKLLTDISDNAQDLIKELPEFKKALDDL